MTLALALSCLHVLEQLSKIGEGFCLKPFLKKQAEPCQFLAVGNMQSGTHTHTDLRSLIFASCLHDLALKAMVISSLTWEWCVTLKHTLCNTPQCQYDANIIFRHTCVGHGPNTHSVFGVFCSANTCSVLAVFAHTQCCRYVHNLSVETAGYS